MFSNKKQVFFLESAKAKMEKLAQGAEAIITRKENLVIKNRFAKGYRHPEIDANLRKFRTRREARILEKLEAINFPAARVLESDDKAGLLKLSFIDGPLVKNVLHASHAELSREIGEKIAILHKNDIIHGDLTTSNMILNSEVNFIDFGLSFVSEKIEDKAVDLHLLRQALESKHHLIWEECFSEALKGYESYERHKEVLKRLEAVEARGRNKH